MAGAAVGGAQADPLDADGVYSRTSPKNFEDVVDDLEFAISEHNYRITGRNRLGSALTERYHEAHADSVVIQFCSLAEARRFLASAPDFLIHMPCKIVVYQSVDGVVVTAALLPPDARLQARIDAVNDMLRRIVDDAVR